MENALRTVPRHSPLTSILTSGSLSAGARLQAESIREKSVSNIF